MHSAQKDAQKEKENACDALWMHLWQNTAHAKDAEDTNEDRGTPQKRRRRHHTQKTCSRRKRKTRSIAGLRPCMHRVTMESALNKKSQMREFQPLHSAKEAKRRSDGAQTRGKERPFLFSLAEKERLHAAEEEAAEEHR